MKLLNDYFKLQKEIYDYFGYGEDWVTIPLDDSTDCWWELDLDDSGVGGEVRFAETIKDLANEAAGNYYSYPIYTQRFLPKWVYEGEDYTMISVDTQTDGNKFLMVFDNNKKVSEIDKEAVLDPIENPIP